MFLILEAVTVAQLACFGLACDGSLITFISHAISSEGHENRPSSASWVSWEVLGVFSSCLENGRWHCSGFAPSSINDWGHL